MLKTPKECVDDILGWGGVSSTKGCFNLIENCQLILEKYSFFSLSNCILREREREREREIDQSSKFNTIFCHYFELSL